MCRLGVGKGLTPVPRTLPLLWPEMLEPWAERRVPRARSGPLVVNTSFAI